MAKNVSLLVEHIEEILLSLEEGTELNPDTFRQLQEANWAVIGKALTTFAHYWADRYQWRRGTSDLLPQGNTIDDIVQRVILKTIEGTRSWDPAKGPLLPRLKDQVKSEIDALAKSAAHTREIPFPRTEDGEELTNSVEQRAVENGILGDPHPPTPETVILAGEEAERVKKKTNALFEAIEGEEELEVVLEAIINGCEPKARYLAEAIGIPVGDVYNRLKRLRRRANGLF
jgi:DNA-directed RNA polymerase specialized sigma24 family protein